MNLKGLTQFSLVAMMAFGCKGSDFYQGSWKSLNTEQEPYRISFTPDSLFISNDTAVLVKEHYTQRSFQVQSGARKYGIQLDDGRTFTISFPSGNGPKKGAIIDQNGFVVYTLGEDDYYEYKEIFGL